MNKQNQLTNKKAFRFKRFVRQSFSVFNSLGKVVTIGVLSGCALQSAHSQSVTSAERIEIQQKQDTLTTEELEEVVVTASKTNLPLSMAAKMVTVITSQEIERSPIQSIEDLLTHYSGIDIQQRGPHGVQSDISIRGGSFDQTAILLNGINLTNPQTGHYSFDIPINLSDIERIEIVQGPSSLAYGAGAFAGGINIITKQDSKSNIEAKLEGGMYALMNAEARGAIKSSASLHQFSAGYRQSDGYIDNSDYKMMNLLWQSRFNIENVNIDLTAGYNDKNYGANTFYTAAFPNQYDDTESIFFSIKGETNGKLKFKPQLYWNRHLDEFQLVRGDNSNIPYNHHRSDVWGTNMQWQYASQLGISSFGGEFRNESILSSVLGKPLSMSIGKYTNSDSRSNISLFAEHNFIFNNITLSLGGLLNHNTAIVDKYEFYPAINTSYRVNRNISLYASWNKATRMPTFTDLYYTTSTHIGNTDLKSEKSEALEAGVKFKNSYIDGYLNAYYMKGRNMIDWMKPNAESLWQSSNLSEIDKYGFETGVNTNLVRLFGSSQPLQSLNIGYMHLKQDMSETNHISNYTLNHLRHKLTASLKHKITDNLTLSWNFRWQDRAGSYIKYENNKPGERTNYKPYSVLDLNTNYKLNNWNLYINATNIFDTTYIDLGNLPQPGIWIMGGVKYMIEI